MVHLDDYIRIADAAFLARRKPIADILPAIEMFLTSNSIKILNLSMPPRFGKSYLATLVSGWMLFNNLNCRLLRVSYSAALAENFSMQVQNIYLQVIEKLIAGGWKCDLPTITGTRARWYIDAATQPSHLAAGIDGSITGFGCDIAIIDDTVKGMMEATSAAYTNQLKLFKDSVLLPRLENQRKIINVGTRWTNTDWFTMFSPDIEIIIPALNDNNKSICEDWKSTTELMHEQQVISPDIWSAQYMQRPTAMGQVRLFEGLKFPVRTPEERGKRYVVCDPATKYGNDYFVCIYFEIARGCVYLLDIYAEQQATATDAAVWIRRLDYSECACESNGIGRSIIEELRNKGVRNIFGFTTVNDKYSRAYIAMEKIKNYFFAVEGCRNVQLLETQADKFPVGEHDDLIDCLIMICEHFHL